MSVVNPSAVTNQAQQPLETLGHLDGTPVRDLPPFVRVSIELPEAIEEIQLSELPTGWDALKYPESLPQFYYPR